MLKFWAFVAPILTVIAIIVLPCGLLYGLWKYPKEAFHILVGILFLIIILGLALQVYSLFVCFL